MSNSAKKREAARLHNEQYEQAKQARRERLARRRKSSAAVVMVAALAVNFGADAA